MQVEGTGKWHSLPPEVKDEYLTHNAPALEAFLQRKAQGLDLSQRVWQVAEGFEQEMELALQVGIAEGADAEQLSRDLRQYLREPERLFRRVRDKFGLLHLSQAAKAYKPGRGVYRSSYKNARRLAATETNIAYCTADHLRWQQLDFVVGIRIALSNNHTCLGRDGKPHRFTDICDQLAGDYPKSFKFVGWHPHCRCIATPILKTPEELESDAPSSNEVQELPDGFRQWREANRERIAAANERGTLPYFVRGNKEFFGLKRDKSDLFYFTPPKLMFRHPEPKKTPLEIAKERHAQRTKEREEEIKKRWEERKKSNSARIRKEIRKQAYGLIGKEFRHPSLEKGIMLTSKRIKEWLNQPHKHYDAKNKALLRIDKLIANANYSGCLPDKHNPIVITHLLETTEIGNVPSWIILRDFPSAPALSLHSISDNDTMAEIAKKKGKS